jgi:YggT family protein
MFLIARIYWFLSWAVVTATVGVILVVVVRMIANAVDVNPFTWFAINIRRLSEPLIAPARRALTRMRVEPKFAPLVVILLVILLAWFVLQLFSNIANTIAGVLTSLQGGKLTPLIGYVLYGLLSFYSLLIFVRIVFSWGNLSYSNRLMRFLINATEPLLAPLRRTIPPVGMFDISPIVAFIIVWLLQSAVAGTLLRGMQLQFFS